MVHKTVYRNRLFFIFAISVILKTLIPKEEAVTITANDIQLSNPDLADPGAERGGLARKELGVFLRSVCSKEEDIRQLVTTAGLDAANIMWHDRASSIWHDILRVAARTNKITHLLAAAYNAYPTYDTWRRFFIPRNR